MNLGVGEDATARACHLLTEHFRFSVCDVDSIFVSASRPSILRLFAEQIHIDASDTKTSEVGEPSGKTVSSYGHYRNSQSANVLWPSARGLTAVQPFPSHFTSLFQFHRDMELHEHARYLSHTMWLEKSLSFHSSDVQMLLLHECGVYGVVLKVSAVRSSRFWQGCFATQVFFVHEVIGYFHVTLLNGSIIDIFHSGEVYGEGVISVTDKDFQTWSIFIEPGWESYIGDYFKFKLFQPESNVFHFVNYPCYLQREKMPSKDQSTSLPRAASFTFVKMCAFRSGYTRYTLFVLFLCALCNISGGKYFSVGQGSDHVLR